MIKGSVVGAAGVALLMGGFGTYATWTDSAVMGESSVKAGELNIAAGTASWAGNGAWETDDLIVPGDVIERTQTFTINATGSNMRGDLDFTLGTKTNPFGEELDIDVDVTVDDATTLVGDAASGWTFEAPLGESFEVETVVTYTFNDQDPGLNSNAFQNATATLGDSSFVITQTR